MPALSQDRRRRVADAAADSLVCEFTTVKDGKPVSHPLTPFYDPSDDVLFVTSCPALSRKFDDVAETPEAAMLLYHGTDPMLVTGTVRLKDVDPWEGAAYMMDVIRRSPDAKRAAFTESFLELPESALTHLLMDWYVLRRIAIFEPDAVTPLPSAPVADVPPIDALGMDATEARRYHRVTISSVDADGYPVTYPVRNLGVAGENLAIEVDDDATVGTGPACLLMHWHTDDIEDLDNRVVRGTVTDAGETLTYRPAGSTTTGTDTALGKLRYLYAVKRRTREYFGETRPWKWHWDVRDVTD
jgi:hypothetical protein